MSLSLDRECSYKNGLSSTLMKAHSLEQKFWSQIYMTKGLCLKLMLELH